MSQKSQRAPKTKRERFDEAGRFPVRKVVIISIVAALAIVGGFAVYQDRAASQQVGGEEVASDVQYPSGKIDAVAAEDYSQTADGLSFSLAEVKQDYIVSMAYNRVAPMPAEFQQVTGGNTLPLLAYISPKGRLVVATSFCEPCRSDKFHVEDGALVCNVCFTRWDLDTLKGIGGGCMAYPPEEVAAQIDGEQVFVSAAQLEAWVPRAF